MFRSLFVAILALAAAAPVTAAQEHAPSLAPLTTDSTAWQRVLVHVVSSLGGQLVQTAVDSSLQPWRIDLPADEPQRTLLGAQLNRIFRARTPVESDSVVFELSLGSLRIARDTARVTFRSSVARRCSGSAHTTGWSNVEEILVPRAPAGWWGAARSIGVRHADRVGCPKLR